MPPPPIPNVRGIVKIYAFAVTIFFSIRMGFFITDQFIYVSSHDSAQRQASLVESTMGFCSIVLAFASTPVVGYLSDCFGRRLALSVVVLGELISLIVLTVVVMTRLSPWFLLLSDAAEALIGGGLTTVVGQVSVCIAELARPLSPQGQHRSSSYTFTVWLLNALIDLLVVLSMASADAVAGALIVEKGFDWAVLVADIAFVPVLFMIAFYWLPETLDRRSSTADDDSTDECCDGGESMCQPNPRRCLARLLSLVKDLVFNQNVGLIFGILFVYTVSALVDTQYVMLYWMNTPFNWNAEKVGLVNFLANLVSTLTSFLLVVLVVKFWVKTETGIPSRQDLPVQELDDEHLHEHDDDVLIQPLASSQYGFTNTTKTLIVLITGLSLFTTSRILLGLAGSFNNHSTANSIVYLSVAFSCLRNTIFPILRTLLSMSSSFELQGRLFAMVSLVESTGLTFALSVMPLIYAASVSTLPSTVFYVDASLAGLGLAMAGRLLSKSLRARVGK